MTTKERDLLRQAAELIRTQTNLGETVQIRGFGTFKIKDKPARTARNPRTGDTVEVPARQVLTFKASKSGDA